MAVLSSPRVAMWWSMSSRKSAPGRTRLAAMATNASGSIRIGEVEAVGDAPKPAHPA
jgi:hypothetical protein